MEELNALSAQVIQAAVEVHRRLGPGLLESVYCSCLELELKLRGVDCRSEVSLPVEYRGHRLDQGFRLDLLVRDQVIVELKAVEKVQPVHVRQLLTYLRLSGKPLGLLMNFNENLLRDGITRLANCPGR